MGREFFADHILRGPESPLGLPIPSAGSRWLPEELQWHPRPLKSEGCQKTVSLEKSVAAGLSYQA